MPLGSVFINFTIDPYNFLNSKYTTFIPISNERYIKTVFLSNHKNQYDSVIIGSSRSSYINASKFLKYNMFNYSISGISLDEYLPYLKFYKKTQGIPRLVILALDFYGSNKAYQTPFKPEIIIKNSLSKFALFMDYTRIKNAHISLKMLISEPSDYSIYYTRDLIKKRGSDKIEGLNTEIIKRNTLELKSDFKNYSLRDDYKSQLLKIKEFFPNSKIVVFICPIHRSLSMATNHLVDPLNYQNWVSEIVSVFGHCYDFNKYDCIVNDEKNFFDASHFYPFVGDKIVSMLSNYVG